MEAREIISQNIKIIRAARHMSSSEFAAELGIARSTLQQLEHGGSPNLATLEHIAKQLGVSVQSLMEPKCAEHADIITDLLNIYDWFFRLPPDQQKKFAAWAKNQLDELVKFAEGTAP